MFIDIPTISAMCGSIAFHSFLWFVGVLMLFLLLVIVECVASGVDSIEIKADDSIVKAFLNAKLYGLAILSFPILGAIKILGWIMAISFSVWFSLAVLY